LLEVMTSAVIRVWRMVDIVRTIGRLSGRRRDRIVMYDNQRKVPPTFLSLPRIQPGFLLLDVRLRRQFDDVKIGNRPKCGLSDTASSSRWREPPQTLGSPSEGLLCVIGAARCDLLRVERGAQFGGDTAGRIDNCHIAGHAKVSQIEQSRAAENAYCEHGRYNKKANNECAIRNCGNKFTHCDQEDWSHTVAAFAPASRRSVRS